MNVSQESIIGVLIFFKGILFLSSKEINFLWFLTYDLQVVGMRHWGRKSIILLKILL